MVDKVLTSIQEMGVTVWLDDFGTGYSSLSYLQSFHFDGVKVDRTFVQDIESNKKNQDLVKAIISLANTLKIDTVIEGIETEAQAAVLQDFGCITGQGYYYAKPLPASAFEQQWLNIKK
nr:EAL domain-containing protein [Psychromonas sp. Urea-02u-13]